MLYRMVALVLDGLVGFPAGLSPTCFHLSPSSFHLSPISCHLSPRLLLVVGFPAGLSPTCFHLSPTSFHLSPSAFHLSPRLGACGRVPGWLVSHFLSFVSQFFSFVSQGGCLWSGSRLACLPLPFICFPVLFICLPGWVLVVGFQAGLSPTPFHLSLNSFHLSPRRGGSRLACLPLPFICLPVLFICLPGWLLVVGFLAGLSPTSFHVSATFSHLSSNSSHLSLTLGACGRVPGWLVCNLLSFVSQFFSFVSQAGCLWSGSWLACLPLPFICLPVLFICLPGWVLVVGFQVGLSPTSFHLSQFFSFVSQAGCLWSGSRLACLPLPFICLPVLFICFPGWLLVVGFLAGLSPALQSFTGLLCPPLPCNP